jgi:class II lanthipeptide synthase
VAAPRTRVTADAAGWAAPAALARSGGRTGPRAAHLVPVSGPAVGAGGATGHGDGSLVAGRTQGPGWMALGLAHRLAEAAVLADGGPRWRGRGVAGDGTVAVVDLGETFETGRAGIAWFLAAAAEWSSDGRLARLARTAASGALAAASAEGYGLAAKAEIARACLDVADVCNDDDLAHAAVDTLDTVLRRTASAAARDLGPSAVDVLARVLLAGLRRSVTPDGAYACGALARALASTAVPRRWAPRLGRTGPGGAPAPCGLPHGTAGTGLALAAAAVALGDSAGRIVPEAALESVRSERAWLDRARVSVATHPSLHCHGAAAVARVRMATVGVLARRRPDASSPALDALAGACADDGATVLRFAMDGVADMTRRLRGRGHDAADLSVCHGAAGIAETLIITADVTGDTSHRRAAHELAVEISRRAAVAPVPGGLPDHTETFGLALGIAGTGATLLRAAGARLPSPTLLGLPRS